jgi:hypothetical protein
MADLGFALLSGDPERSPSRHLVSDRRRHVLWNEVGSFCHRNSAWELQPEEDSLIILDEPRDSPTEITMASLIQPDLVLAFQREMYEMDATP